MLQQYFEQAPLLTPDSVGLHVYRLFQWIDPTIGLAHCYDSNHAQPGKPWYRRTIRFHGWLADQLGCTPAEVGENVDWLFRKTVEQLSQTAIADEPPELPEGFPRPGEDEGLVAMLSELLGNQLAGPMSAEQWREISLAIHTYVGTTNKRNNLTGEGFEDTLATIVSRMPGTDHWSIFNRMSLGEIPDFREQGGSEKPKKVDVVMWTGDRRILVTSKWSYRADREEQFGNDFAAYVKSNAGLPFEHVLVTNEFDAARLKRAIQWVEGNQLLFDRVVHVSTDALLHAHGPRYQNSARLLPDAVADGRLVSLGEWIESLTR